MGLGRVCRAGKLAEASVARVMWKITAILAVASFGLVPGLGLEPTSKPAPPGAPSNRERLTDLLALIEGPNTPEVRRTIARELLLQGWPETKPRLVTLLRGSNGPAKVAVASALGELPQFLVPEYIDPFMQSLADTNPTVREAAAAALAAYRDHGVTPRLRELVLNAEQPQSARLAAVVALGLMTKRDTIEGLVELLAVPDPDLARAALTALEQATGMDFSGEGAAARDWWEESRALSLEAWQQLQIERLVRKDRATRRRLEAVEARLAKVLEAGFLRAPDAERVSLLSGYLSDSALTIRLLGLRFAQLHLAEGKMLPADLQEQIRQRMGAADPREQGEAVRTVASLRAATDAEYFLAKLAGVEDRRVRLALLNGLGYVGTAAATEALLSVLESADEKCVTEAVTALGRLAERGVLEDGAREAVATALSGVFEQTTPSQVALCERILWAMGNLADPRFGPAFAAALEQPEAVAVRQAAARGIAALNDPALADALLPATADPDAGIRKTAVETLAALGSDDAHLAALWERVVSPEETDEAIRQAAWRGVVDLISKRPAREVAPCLASLSVTSPPHERRLLELLQRLARTRSESESVDRGWLGVVRARLAAKHARLGQPTEAITAYIAALGDLHAAGSDVAPRVAAETLRYALVHGLYDATVAAAVGSGNPEADYGALWAVVQAEVELRLTPQGVEEALAMLDAVAEHPPGAWPPTVAEALADLRARAMQINRPATPAPTSAPASQPTSAPASQPEG